MIQRSFTSNAWKIFTAISSQQTQTKFRVNTCQNTACFLV